MRNMKKIDIVIVNWNASYYLKECVESVVKYSNDLVNKIVVVDNSSTDDSLLLINEFTDLELVENSENLGFAKACNIGAKICSSEYILFLNPDAKIYSKTLKNALVFMCDKKNLNVGICGVQLYNENGEIARSNSRFPSVIGLLSRSIGLGKVFPSLGSPMSEWDHSSTKVVDQVIGAFFFVKRHVFQELAGFDEQFFVYYEEVDFSVRAKQIGWSSVYFAGAQAFHVGGAISKQVKAKRIFYTQRSLILYVNKHFNVIKITLVLLIILLIEPVTRISFSIGSMSILRTKEIFRAYAMLYKWFFLSFINK